MTQPIGPAYTYSASITSLHDGDTVTVDVDLGMDVWKKGQVLRLLGINASELVVGGRHLNRPGLDARDALVQLLTAAPTTAKPPVYGIPGDIEFSVPTPVIITTIKDKTEKFGRLLAVIWLANSDGTQLNVNDWMVSNGHAVKYMVA